MDKSKVPCFLLAQPVDFIILCVQLNTLYTITTKYDKSTYHQSSVENSAIAYRSNSLFTQRNVIRSEGHSLCY